MKFVCIYNVQCKGLHTGDRGVLNCFSQFVYIYQKRIKRENLQDSTSQQIFDLEKLVFYSY